MNKLSILCSLVACFNLATKELPDIFSVDGCNIMYTIKNKCLLIDGTVSSHDARIYAKNIAQLLTQKSGIVFSFIDAKKESFDTIIEDSFLCAPCVAYVDNFEEIYSFLGHSNNLMKLDEIDKTMYNIVFIIRTSLTKTHLDSSLFRQGRLHYLDIRNNRVLSFN